KETTQVDFADSDKFFSPLVKNIAKEEGVSVQELEAIAGTGKDGRVTKNDILDYVKNRGSQAQSVVASTPAAAQVQPQVSKPVATPATKAMPVSVNGQDERSEEHTSELQSRENLVC